jgi:hypothetical protein
VPVPAQAQWSGQSNGWRYLAQRIDGSGVPGPFLATELPLTNVKITDVLSGPPQLTGDLDPAFRGLLGPDGLPILTNWGTVVYAEADGVISAGGLLVDAPMNSNGPVLSLDCSGFCGYPVNMHYPSADSFTQVDALDVVRWIWAKIQNDVDSNLGLLVDPFTKAGVNVGTPVTTDASGNQTGGPYWLTWWANQNLGGDIDALAKLVPFDYHERHVWHPDYSTVDHFLDFGVPTLGRRRTDLRFVYGENIQTVPQPTNDGTDFSNHVIFLGSGTGSAMVHEEARIRDGRLRRTATVTDSGVSNDAIAKNTARLELARRNQTLQLSQIYIRDSGNAPLGSFGVGDEIRIQAETDWAAFDIWSRVITLQIQPDVPDMMLATLVRSDWVA